MIAPLTTSESSTFMESMRTNFSGDFLQRSSDTPNGAMKPNQEKNPMNAPSEALWIPMVLIANASTNRVTKVAKKWMVYDFHMPRSRIFSTSSSETLMRDIHSLPKRNEEYQTAPIKKLMTAAMTIAQMLIVNMEIRK